MLLDLSGLGSVMITARAGDGPVEARIRVEREDSRAFLSAGAPELAVALEARRPRRGCASRPSPDRPPSGCSPHPPSLVSTGVPEERRSPASARRSAVALRYRDGVDAAPVVAATGHGEVAERIIETASRAGVPLREDPDLAQALAHLDIDDLVPPELYRVIAEVMAWAYRMNQRYVLDAAD